MGNNYEVIYPTNTDILNEAVENIGKDQGSFMKNRNGGGFDYLRQYPKLRKWINICFCCGNIGYNPELPEKLTRNCGQGKFDTVAARYIRKYYKPLKVNKSG